MGRGVLPVAVAVACLWLLAFGVLVGVAVERIRFDVERAAVISRLTSTEARVRARLMDLEGRAGVTEARGSGEPGS